MHRIEAIHSVGRALASATWDSAVLESQAFTMPSRRMYLLYSSSRWATSMPSEAVERLTIATGKSATNALMAAGALF